MDVATDAMLTAVGSGDRAAYADLFDTLGPQSYALAVRVVRSAARAEEVVQEAWLQVWRDAARFKKHDRETYWVTVASSPRAAGGPNSVFYQVSVT